VLLVLVSDSRLSCWWVSLCHADLRKPSFLWSEDLFEEVGEEDEAEDDEEEEDFEDGSLFL
jgi:hypothetical protein